jgi:hypothetical protein
VHFQHATQTTEKAPTGHRAFYLGSQKAAEKIIETVLDEVLCHCATSTIATWPAQQNASHHQ